MTEVTQLYDKLVLRLGFIMFFASCQVLLCLVSALFVLGLRDCILNFLR